MFGGFFNRMYYGDPRKPDLKKGDVVDNRFKLFFTVLQIRFWQLIQLNLLWAVFWIPAFLLLNFQLMISAETGDPISILFFLLLIPCLVITGPATAGATYVIRNWARDEHAWVWSDFKDAFKQNWKESMIIMGINGLVLMIFYVNMLFYRSLAIDNIGFSIIYYLMLMIGFLYLMMNMYLFPMLVTYKLSIRQLFKNAILFVMVKLPFNFLIFLISGALVIMSLMYIVGLPLFIVGFSFPALIVISFVNWMFDKYLNQKSQDTSIQ